jgi:CrcB protein
MPGRESARGPVRSDHAPAQPRAEDLPPDPDTAPTPAAAARRDRQWDVLAVVSLGGGLGSVARYGLARAWPTPAGGFPWATFATNAVGSLALGLLMVYVVEVWPPARYRRPFLGVGIIGGFTTFSTWMNETRGLLATGRFALADAYALTSLVAGLAAVWTGIALARWWSGRPVRRGPRRRHQAGRTATAELVGTAATTGASAGEPAAEGAPK